PFAPPAWALLVNGLWLASLMISLFAAVTAMLVKEWLRAYHTDTAHVPVERAQQRQFRYDGMLKWFLPNIVSSLPLFIHLSVFLFATGLVVYTWSLSLVLSMPLIVLLAIAFGLYTTSAIAP
ncbi:hypothetical protein CALCODRAFT_420470, partial [Calocera cornea HHB12733]